MYSGSCAQPFLPLLPWHCSNSARRRARRATRALLQRGMHRFVSITCALEKPFCYPHFNAAPTPQQALETTNVRQPRSCREQAHQRKLRPWNRIGYKKRVYTFFCNSRRTPTLCGWTMPQLVGALGGAEFGLDYWWRERSAGVLMKLRIGEGLYHC